MRAVSIPEDYAAFNSCVYRIVAVKNNRFVRFDASRTISGLVKYPENYTLQQAMSSILPQVNEKVPPRSQVEVKTTGCTIGGARDLQPESRADSEIAILVLIMGTKPIHQSVKWP